MMMMQQQILNGFTKAFGAGSDKAVRIFFAPGRVNLIGEHIDYNGGLVLPCALDIGTYGAIRLRDDNTIRLVSGNFETSAVTSLDSLAHKKSHGWANYPKAVVTLLLEMGHPLSGFEMYIWGNLPSGAGLSSSASLNSMVAFALNEMFELNIDPIERIKLCQKAEVLNGVNCGIMDVFACTLGKKDHAILLDCNTLEYKYIPLNLGDYRILIGNTNRKRGLTDSKYNERVEECNQALADLQKVCSIKALCDLTPDAFDKHASAITDETNRRRAKHVVYENQRTKDAAKAMEDGKLEELFHLMIASHISLRDLYEVACWALDAMVQPAFLYGANPSDPPILLGTRMTGAGFGGCTVSLVHRQYIDDFIKHVGEEYRIKTGITADFYVAEPDDGVREIIK